jgi:hypothetical protein
MLLQGRKRSAAAAGKTKRCCCTQDSGLPLLTSVRATAVTVKYMG